MLKALDLKNSVKGNSDHTKLENNELDKSISKLNLSIKEHIFRNKLGNEIYSKNSNINNLQYDQYLPTFDKSYSENIDFDVY